MSDPTQAATIACPEHDPHPQKDGTEWCPNCGLGASDGTSKSQAATVACPERAPLTEPDTTGARTKVVGVRMTEAEYEALVAVATERRMSPPEVLRLSWFLVERLEANHV